MSAYLHMLFAAAPVAAIALAIANRALINDLDYMW